MVTMMIVKTMVMMIVIVIVIMIMVTIVITIVLNTGFILLNHVCDFALPVHVALLL